MKKWLALAVPAVPSMPPLIIKKYNHCSLVNSSELYALHIPVQCIQVLENISNLS